MENSKYIPGYLTLLVCLLVLTCAGQARADSFTPLTKCDCCTCTYCGDGIVISPEMCDDANNDQEDFCRNCRLPKCGDGINNQADLGEECDGNLFNNFIRPAHLPKNTKLYCNRLCEVEYCGDGLRDHDEACDIRDFGLDKGIQPGNDGQSCNSDCSIASCGDGLRNGTEICDGKDFGLAAGVQAGQPGQACVKCQVQTSTPTPTPSPTPTKVTCKYFKVTFSKPDGRGNTEDKDANGKQFKFDLKKPEYQSKYDSLQSCLKGKGVDISGKTVKKNEISNKLMELLDNGAWETGYLDSNCNVIKKLDGSPLCGELRAYAYSSPISLILPGSAGINQNWTIAQFQHDPRGASTWGYWKATEETPLLVYDPKHTGVITSGAQLFGNYTFGSKSGIQSQEKYIWTNGFEALSSLDSNKDGRLSDSELDSISLWFDKNRDAISDPGEVIPAAIYGIVSLNTVSDSTDVRGDIYSSLGYELSKAGKIYKGVSVDWFTQVFSSKAEALDDVIAKQKTLGAEKQLNEQPIKLSKQNYSGSYLWGSDDIVDGGRRGGVLILKDDGENVSGYSIVETALQENEDDYIAQLNRFKVTGTKYEKFGKVFLKFHVLGSDQSKALVETTAYLQDGNLLGSSKTVIDNVENSTEVNYEWTASKLEN